MDESQIRFDDGAAYERFMGVWSRLAGDVFLDWLAPPPGLRWIDVGCGNGAFSELLARRCAPSSLVGIDPSEAQVAYARERLGASRASFEVGDAQALPHGDASFDAAVMALVIFFVPEPAAGVAEMARVVRPGGLVSAYAWDIVGGGFPFAAVQEEMAALGIPPLLPPSVDAARLDVLRSLWQGAGLVDLRTREIVVQRAFESFDAYWSIVQSGPRLAPRLQALPAADHALLQQRLRDRLESDADRRIVCRARAHAIEGRVAGEP